MEGLPSVIPKSIVEVLNRLENDEDNLFSWNSRGVRINSH